MKRGNTNMVFYHLQGTFAFIKFYSEVLTVTDLLMFLQLETNSPGLVVAVTVDGKEVWTKGLLSHTE